MLDQQSVAHKSLATNILANLCQPLQALLKDMDTRRKQV